MTKIIALLHYCETAIWVTEMACIWSEK